jgi:RecA-family ATPase
LDTRHSIISIPEDIPLIEKAVERVSARLLIIDPLSAFMRGDPNKDNDLRKAPTPLANMAERMDVAVLVVRHFNKNVESKALYRGGGSIGIIGAARSALAVAQHPNDDDLRVLVPQKGNLSKKAQSLSYTIVTAENSTARIEWKGTVDLNADELLNVNQGELARAKAWLIEKLKDGPVPFNEIRAVAEEANISESTLKRAKVKLGVQSK